MGGMEVEPDWAAKAPMEKGEGSEWQGLWVMFSYSTRQGLF